LFLAGVIVTGASASNPDEDFETLAAAYIADLLQHDPEWATSVGDHRYDNRLTDRSADGVAARVALHKRYLEKLDQIPTGRLNRQNRIDCMILRTNADRMVFEAEVLRTHEWNPRYYNAGGAIYDLLVRDFAPLEGRLRSIRSRLIELPTVIAAAKANLRNPPRIHTETAIRQNRGNIRLIRDELNLFLLRNDSFREEIRPVQYAAISTLEAYGEWLANELLPRANGDFRLGDELWRQKLRYTLESDLSKEEILERALAELGTTKRKMYDTALPLYRAYYPNEPDARKLDDVDHVCRRVLAKLAEERPDNETIVAKAEVSLAEATEFVRKHNLVTVPDEPVELIVMPEFKRGVAVAYCDAPGPLEKDLDTFFAISPTPEDWSEERTESLFFAISPTPEDWSEERTESFFKEYNDYMLHNLTVHEAMPGHYLQLAHANEFQAPTMVRALFSSGPFVEGWAVYSERLMVENGYGGPKVRMQQLKMRLRVIINAIIDQKIHTAGMTEEEAMAFMKNEGYQEEGEAAGKWRRACLTSTQLSTYFVGCQEVEDIRREYEKKRGIEFDLQKFHDKLLSYGSPPPRYVRELMGLR
jgi:uncharacterized protein (DUF885 family)